MQTHILGFPSIGKNRELKRALEDFWTGSTGPESLEATAESVKQSAWLSQKNLSFVTVGDFSLYDRMLDTTCWLGAIPQRFAACGQSGRPDFYFALARGDAARGIAALEMTKWFDTNYHYLVPELDGQTRLAPGPHPALADAAMAAELGFRPKAAIIGPFTWLALAKSRGNFDKWTLLPDVARAYSGLVGRLAKCCGLIQVEEPVLCTDWLCQEYATFSEIYAELNRAAPHALMLTTYFGALGDNLDLAVSSGCAALHVDMVRGRPQLEDLLAAVPSDMKLSLGLVNGRNIWKNDYRASLDVIERSRRVLGAERVMAGTSCSLLHCPVDLSCEDGLDAGIRSRMAFAVQKCSELIDLERVADKGETSLMAQNAALFRAGCPIAGSNIPAVRERSAKVGERDLRRKSPLPARRRAQDWLNLPRLPTTTIGSYPQTDAIRRARRDFRQGAIGTEAYEARMREEIRNCVRKQEELGLDVLVHGEAERTDMVEYFGSQLGGFCFTCNGWVQSYGSRCVKPPVIYGDVYRKCDMTVKWLKYAQSLTTRPMKGMLTGPVTILCWSFVREDLPRADVCRQIALAIRDEVADLEKSGIGIIQIDEAAFREGMPLTRAEAEEYLAMAVDAFLLASTCVEDRTQIHSHMCYSEFNAILPWIAKMDADVISIESSRSGMELLEAFDGQDYAGQIGPGVYDIHSPRVPSADEMATLLRKALLHIPADQLWVNPDCGLKTRRWDEALPSLENMVSAAKIVRREI